MKMKTAGCVKRTIDKWNVCTYIYFYFHRANVFDVSHRANETLLSLRAYS